jgi:hypothetical protein
MALYYGKHKVKDYDKWRPYFDTDEERKWSHGAKAVSVMRSVSDPNEVHFVFDIPDLDAFMSMMRSPELGAILQEAGVLEQPVMYRLEELR